MQGSRQVALGIAVLLVVLALADHAAGLGCPCVRGQAFIPFSGPGHLEVPRGKLVEEELQNFVMNWIGQTVNGPHARASFNKPGDLRDYAYEHSKIMSDNGAIEFPNWPPNCGSLVGTTTCDWEWYREKRALNIGEFHSMDFTAAGYPLQSKTGGVGYCVQSVEEFYGFSQSLSPTTLVNSLLARHPTAFPNALNGGTFVTGAHPHLYGVAVYVPNEMTGPAWLTVIRVNLLQAAPCECSLGACAAKPPAP